MQSPSQVVQWLAFRTHDLVVVSSKPGWGEISFRSIFAPHICCSMWEKWSVAFERNLCQHWCEKARKHMCVTDRHDMTLAVKVALNLNTTNQPTNLACRKYIINEKFRLMSACAVRAGWHGSIHFANVYRPISTERGWFHLYFTEKSRLRSSSEIGWDLFFIFFHPIES